MNAIALNARLNISDILIRQDAEGRYCLNDLHVSSGNESKHKPANFLRNQQAVDLIELLKSEKLEPVSVINGIGTLAVKELVYAYAMWISAKFHLAVIRAYDALQKPKYEQSPEPKTKKALPNGLSLEQQDTIKALVNARAEGLPKSQQTRAIIQGWSAIKKKFELGKKQTYKEISPDNFVNVISLLARLPLEGELVEKDSDEFLSSHQYRDEARRSLNAHLDACHADMAQAGVKAPEWPTMDEKTITGLASGLLWQSRWLMSFNLDTMKPQLQTIPMNAQALSFEQWIDHAKNRGYVVIKKSELLHKLEASN